MSWRRVSHLFVMAIVTTMACIVSIWMLLITVVAHISPPHPVVMQIGWKSGKEKSSMCGNDEEKFMYYAPHSGFSNQVIEFKNALVFAKLLNRTLIVPPVLDHHTAWLGSCPKGRVLSPHRLQNLVLTTILDLILSSRYISVTSLIDISTISPSRVRTIGLRRFLTLWCGIDVHKFSGGDICKTCPKNDSVQAALKTCIGLLNPLPVHAAQQHCYVYGVDDDCTSTIWRNLRVAPYHNKTRGRTELCNINSSIKCSHDSHGGAAWANVNPLRNVKRGHLLTDDAGERSSEWKLEKKWGRKKVLDITTSLGRDSPTGAVPVLAFGSMFSTIYKGSHTYIDFQYPSGDADADEFFQALKLLKFNPDIVVAARTYVQEVISKPFFCAQLRLLDGQFKNHRGRTLRNFEDRVLLLHHASAGSRHPIPVFVMTDLLPENWTGTALGNIRDCKTLYHIHRLNSSEDVIESASRSILEGEFGFEVPAGSLLARETHEQPLTYLSSVIPLVLLCVEEVVCSCASLGFLGTEGSTITESIMDLRAAQICREVSTGPLRRTLAENYKTT